MGAEWLDELNEAQRRAATHPGGPVLVIAGAGSGKTKTLACRVAWLLEQGASPDRILLLTFTRRAAAELLGRAGRITGHTSSGQVWGGTFHATANRLLRQYGRSVGLSPEFTVLDQADAADLMNLVRGELGLGQGKRRFPQKNTLVSIYSRMVNGRIRLGEVVHRFYPWCEDCLDGLRQLFEQYSTRKRARHLLDYDDLLLYWHALCGAGPAREALAGRFEHVLVDEYQDTNLIQAEILRAMCPAAEGGRPNILVVGDDAQAIYSFRSATVRNILDFPEQFPGTEVVTLEQNYRSTQPILDASNAVMAQAGERYTKELFTQRKGEERPAIVTCQDETEQSTVVCDEVLRKREEGVLLRRQAVLFRAGHHSDQLEVELSRRNIPFVKYGGLKFVEAAHIKDILAFLRLLENPADEVSWYRVLQLLEGIGPAAARRTIEELGIRGGTAPGDSPLQRLLLRPPTVPPAAREEFLGLRQAAAECLGQTLAHTGPGTITALGTLPLTTHHSPEPVRQELPPAAQVARIRRFYEPLLRRLYDNPAPRLRDLDQLEQIAGRYPFRGQFITDLTLDPPSSTQDLAGPPLLDEDYLILSTIHSAKGGEWDSVYILHASDGMIPSDMATGSPEEIDEERRLLYVAMTRARNTLSLFFPLRYYDRPRGRSDRHSYSQLTRFIPPSALHLFERRTTQPIPRPVVSEAAAPGGAAVAVDTLLRELWSG